MNKKYLLFILSCLLLLPACDAPDEKVVHKKTDYIKKIEGRSDSIPVKTSVRGEVLIAYSDCYTCHTKEKRSKGPAFSDIAKRYPVNKAVIETLAQRVINGGYGAWGKSVMTPHPKLSTEEAKTMVSFILSLKK